MESLPLTQLIEHEVSELGFGLMGVAPAVAPSGFARFEDWLDAGFSGEMHYLNERREAYRHPDSVMEGVKSVVMLSFNYFTTSASPGGGRTGRVARYAWGNQDYHDLIHRKFKQIKKRLFEAAPSIRVRGVVDTAPLLEREFAQLAGLGWFGKNTMLINKHRGSWFFLAALLIDAQLEYDSPHSTSHCGTCTACLEACPTDAFPSAGVLDANRCISYLTIEHRSPIPRDLRPGMGSWVLGCDICQEVCPWNRKSQPTQEDSFFPLPGQNPIDLPQLFDLDDQHFRERFRKTPLWRPGRRGLLRNAAIALGNNVATGHSLTPDENDAVLAALYQGLNDQEVLVRGASAWALGRCQSALTEAQREQVTRQLSDRLRIEWDSEVAEEVRLALEALTGEGQAADE